MNNNTTDAQTNDQLTSTTNTTQQQSRGDTSTTPQLNMALNHAHNALMRTLTLPPFTNSIGWLELSHQLISLSLPEDNKVRFLTLYQALPTELQRDYSHHLFSERSNTYAELKDDITQRITPSQHEKYVALFTQTEMGYRSPIEFLRDLRRKFSDAGHQNIEHLRSAFMMALPEQYRTVVLSHGPDKLDVAAKIIEDAWRVSAHKQLFPLNKIDKHTEPANKELCETDAQLNLLLTKVEQLSAELNQLRSGTDRNNKPQQPERRPYIPPHLRCPPIPTRTDPQGLCYYHAKFGTKAYRCSLPCRWRTFSVPKHNCDKSSCLWQQYERGNNLNL